MKTRILRPLRSVLRRLAWNAVGLTSHTASGMTLRITNPSDWFVFNEIFVKGEYDTAIGIALEHAGERMRVLDLGANVGFFSLRVLDQLRTQGRTDVQVEIVAVEFKQVAKDQLIRDLYAPYFVAVHEDARRTRKACDYAHRHVRHLNGWSAWPGC